ncbi:hypothetical protein MMC11_005939 [Xylographa trunciseda]|nr:hypothetical protein [Xylographa trunciseda]
MAWLSQNNPCAYQGENPTVLRRFQSEAKYIHTRWGFDVATNDYPASLFRNEPDTPMSLQTVRKLKKLAEWFPDSGRAVVNAILEISQSRRRRPLKSRQKNEQWIVARDMDAFIEGLSLDPATLRPTRQFPAGNFGEKARKTTRDSSSSSSNDSLIDRNVDSKHALSTRPQGNDDSGPRPAPSRHPREDDNVDPQLLNLKDVESRHEAHEKSTPDQECSKGAEPPVPKEPRQSGLTGNSMSGEAFTQMRRELLEEYVRLVKEQARVYSLTEDQATRLVNRSSLMQSIDNDIDDDFRERMMQKQGQRIASIPVLSIETPVRLVSGNDAQDAIGGPPKPDVREAGDSNKQSSADLMEHDMHVGTPPTAVGEAESPPTSVNQLRGLPKGGYDEQNPHADQYDFNSCAIDCIATLFKLLRVSERPGYTQWKATLNSSLAESLFDLVDQDWSLPDHELNKAKMAFYNEAIELNGEGSGSRRDNQHYLQHLSVGEILAGLHRDLIKIVGFETDHRAWCRKCDSVTEPDTRHFTCVRSNCGAVDGLIRDTVRDFFGDKGCDEERYYCPNGHLCDLHAHFVENLPKIMFVMLDGRKVNGDSTPIPFKVKYKSSTGIRSATYEWLGSICYRERDNHYKLFWASENLNEILSYDHHDGPDINCYRHGRNVEDAIPEEWWTQGELVVLQRSDVQLCTRGHRALAIMEDVKDRATEKLDVWDKDVEEHEEKESESRKVRGKEEREEEDDDQSEAKDEEEGDAKEDEVEAEAEAETEAEAGAEAKQATEDESQLELEGIANGKEEGSEKDNSEDNGSTYSPPNIIGELQDDIQLPAAPSNFAPSISAPHIRDVATPRRYKGTSFIVKKVARSIPGPAIGRSSPNPSKQAPAGVTPPDTAAPDPFGQAKKRREQTKVRFIDDSITFAGFQGRVRQNPQRQPFLSIADVNDCALWRVTETIPGRVPIPSNVRGRESAIPSGVDWRIAIPQEPKVMQSIDNIFEWESE